MIHDSWCPESASAPEILESECPGRILLIVIRYVTIISVKNVIWSVVRILFGWSVYVCIYFSVVFNYAEFELGTLFSVVFIATV